MTRNFALTLLATTCMISPHVTQAQVTPNSGETQVYTAPNGVPVIDIAKANGAGLSHNKFNDYNVTDKGLVLNNGNISQISRASQLAGQVAANLNLTDEAKVILNEVVMPNRSNLEGFTEVVGGEADVIVANPYGITCNGCGFINTSNATLTTGVPQFGAGGGLSGFRTEDGDITITGDGLNGASTDYLALISRAVTVDGQINAKELDIIAGGSDFDYDSKTATTRATAATAAPAVAIDSSALGGMYANKIRLIATENGVGVRMRGEAAANTGDFTIDSAGKITLSSKLSAKGDLNIETSATGADVIHATDAKLVAERDVSLSGTGGEIHLQGGTIKADRNLTISGSTLSDEKTATADADNNKRHAGNDLTFDTTGTAALDGVSYGAGNSLTGNAGNLSIGAQGATLYSNNTLELETSGTLALNKAAVKSTNDMTLTSTAGNIVTQADAAQGIQSTSGNVALRAVTGLTNAGTIAADTGNVSLNISGTTNNSGTVSAKNNLALADNTGASTGTITNSGKLIGENDVDIKGASLTNSSGGFVQGVENMQVALTGSLSNSGSIILLDSTHTKTASITAGSITNNGMIYSGGDLDVISSSQISNQSSGGLAAYRNLDVNANNYNFDNDGAIYAGNLIDIYNVNEFYNRATGTVNSNNDMEFDVRTFRNRNDIFAARNINISASNEFHNEIEGGDTRVWNYGTYGATSDSGWVGGGFFGAQPQYLLLGETSNRYYSRSKTDTQTYGVTPTAAMRAQLIAGNTLSVSDFMLGSNLGSIMSAPTITLAGAGGATFTNDAYSIKKTDITDRWHDHADCCTGVNVIITYNIDDGLTSTDTVTSAGPGAHIYANSFTATGLGLTNIASVLSPTIASATGSGTTFGGVTLTLPTNPNGFFVVNKDPNSKFLVETNPLFTDPNMMGSDYLMKRLGIDPDYMQRRLGDASYEAYLVRQQLIAQIGTNVILQGGNEAAQMQNLMDNGADQGKALGLTYGKPLTQEQITSLKDDMVWMVETEVNGQTVLAPVVYLAAATKEKFEQGAALIAANTINMDLDSLTNRGGTISGSESIKIASIGDITNLSGSITGGDVDLKSTGGSIINETYASTTGNGANAVTDIGKTATIGSTGNLNLDAKNDIVNKGADLSAGGNADLNAGGNITFDTVQDTRASTTYDGNTVTNEGSTTNIRSGLNVGGNLKTQSGNDTTFAGTDVDVAGDATINAGGNLNILSRDDTKTTSTTTTRSGAGVGGGIWGVETEQNDTYQSRNKGTNFNVGNNATFDAGKDLTIQGSNITAGADVALNAGNNVNIIEGRDIDRSTSSTTTTTFGKVDMGEGFEVEDAGEDEEQEERGGYSASAEASAKTGHKSSGGVTLSETSTVTTSHNKSTAAGSSIQSGGDMKITAGNGVTVRGSDVEADGAVDITSKNVTVTAAVNTETTTTTTNTSKVGFYGGTDNSAGAGASAEAYASADQLAAGANAGANASASTSNTVDLVRVDNTSETITDVTHQGSSIKSGGNTKIKADETLKVHGSSLESDGDMGLEANDMSFTAANDSHTESISSSHTRAGLYADADASAEAGANIDAAGMTGQTGAGASAEANAGIGLYGSNTTGTQSSGSTTAQTSSIKSGGDLTRKATGNITDEGTQIEAGGNFTQEAENWDSKAAKNTTFSSNDSESNTAKLGVYGKASAEASAEADTLYKTDYEAGAGASAGVSASYDRQTSTGTSGSSEAVTSNIKAGGTMKSTTTGKTSLEGTNMASDGDMELNAGSLDYKAARNTEIETEGKTNANAKLEVGMDATKSVSGAIGGGYGEESSSSSSSTAVAGSMNSGGKLKIKTDGDANFEGTNIESAGDANIDAGGDVNFNAAHNTSTSSETSWNVAAELSATKSKGGGKSADGNSGTGKGFNVEGGYATSTESSDEAVAGSIKSGGNLNIKSGKSATFEGTGIESAGNATVEAEEDIAFNAAESTSSSSGWGIDGSINGSKGGVAGQNGKTRNRDAAAEGGINGNYSESSERTSEASTIQSGGNLKLKAGNDINLEGTNIESDGRADLEAGNDVNFTAATDTSHSVDFSAGGQGIVTKEGADENGDGVAKQVESKGKAGFDLSGGDSTTKTGGSINAKTIGIKSGNDINLEGTQIESAGTATLDADGNVNRKAAESSNIEGGLGVGVGTRGAGLKSAALDTGSESQDVSITQHGEADIAPTVETDRGENTGGSAGEGDSPALTALYNQVKESAAADVPASAEQNTIAGEIANLDADTSLSPQQKEEKRTVLQAKLENQKTIDFVKQDKTMTQAQKDVLLKELDVKQKQLDSRTQDISD